MDATDDFSFVAACPKYELQILAFKVELVMKVISITDSITAFVKKNLKPATTLKCFSGVKSSIYLTIVNSKTKTVIV